MKEYFDIIRRALSENREKGSTYFEAHHIIPKSFGKKSTTVLLLPEEHYVCHKLLAEYFKNHSLYGKKMLWAFHRLSYDKGRKLTELEYAESRRMLMHLWKAKKTESHKKNMSTARKGTKTIVHPDTNEIKRITPSQLEDYLQQGWINTNKSKGIKKNLSDEYRNTLKKKAIDRLSGKKGLQASASKGPYSVLYENGNKITAGSYPELVLASGIKYSTLQYRVQHFPGVMLKGFAVCKGT